MKNMRVDRSESICALVCSHYLLLCLFLGLLVSTAAAQACLHDGDVNQDTRVTPADALRTFRHFLGLVTLSACEQDHANVLNPGDSDITPADALCIFQMFLTQSATCLGNAAPIVTSPGNQRHTQGDSVSLLLSVHDADDTALTVRALNLPPGLTITPSTGAVAGTIAATALGLFHVIITASDGRLEGSATFDWDVVARPPAPAPNLPPTANNIMATTDEDTSVTMSVLNQVSDPDGSIDRASVQVDTLPLHGVGQVNADGSVTYNPIANFHGTDTFSYTVADNTGTRSTPAIVTIVVQPVNDPPVANAGAPQGYTLTPGASTVEVTLDGSLSTDLDGTIKTYRWTGTPNPADEVKPHVSLGVGTHTFTLVVVDDLGASSDPATVTITVNPPPARCPGVPEPCNCAAEKGDLVALAGNKQSVPPGGEVTLVVQAMVGGIPRAGVEVTADIRRGSGASLQPEPASCALPQRSAVRQADASGPVTRVTVLTDRDGKASFRLRAGPSEDILAEVTAALADAPSVQFFTIVGSIDTPDLPLDLAVASNKASGEVVVFVADRSTLQVIDATNPTALVRLQAQSPLQLQGLDKRLLKLVGNRLYVATLNPVGLTIVDVSNPRAADFPTRDSNGDGTPDVVLGRVDLPDQVQDHFVAGLEVQGKFAYVLTRVSGRGTLQVIDVSDETHPQRVDIDLAIQSRPAGVAASGNVLCVAAGVAGLLVFDIRKPARPTLVNTFKPADVERFSTNIAMAGSLAYVVETQRDKDRFSIIDLSTPTAPQRRGAVATHPVPRGAYSVLAVAGPFVYLVQGPFGIQVIDIQVPTTPRLVGRLDTPSVAISVAAAGTFVYVTDEIFGLQVLRGPGSRPGDVRDDDGDGIVNFFDAFPTNRAESQDTDRDRVGDNADLDDDDDSFSDAVELQASPPTDSADARSFPVTPPPGGHTTIIVDASTTLLPRERRGTPEAPYRSLTEALRGLRAMAPSAALQLRSLRVRPGIYSSQTTQESFPLDFDKLSHLHVQGTGYETTVIDAGFTAEAVQVRATTGTITNVIFEGFTFAHGVHGVSVNNASEITLRRNLFEENSFHGIEINTNNDNIRVTNNIIRANVQHGISVFNASSATITDNDITDNGGGIFVVTDATADITANRIMQNSGNGITIQELSKATITSNLINENKLSGIFAVNQSTVTLTANTLRGNVLRGVQLRNNTHATLTANTIDANEAAGVDVLDGSTAMLHANMITGNLRGLFVSQPGSMATVMANTIRGNLSDGLFVLDHAQVDAVANTITANGLRGVDVSQTSTVTLVDNLIADHPDSGLFVGSQSTVELTTNIITRNKMHGVVVQTASTARLTANTIEANSQLGIFASGASSTVLATANLITGSGRKGVHLQDAASATVLANTIRGNQQEGIALLTGATASIHSGTITQNGGDGITLSGTASASIGLDGDRLTVTQNSGAGIRVTNDGSSARLNRARIVLTGNTGGTIVGAVVETSPVSPSTTVIVDAMTLLSAGARRGTPEAPYRSITEALQALRAMPSGTASQLKTLYIRAGTYGIHTTQETFPLDFRNLSYVSVQGAGRTTTVIDATGAARDVVHLPSITGVVLEGLALRNGVRGVVATNAREVTLRRTLIEGNSDNGLQTSANSTNITLVENIIRANGHEGMVFFGATVGVTITDNDIQANTGTGIFLVDKSTATMTANRIIDNGGHGILVQDTSDATITANTIDSNTQTGLFVTSQSTAMLLANTITSNGQRGILLQSGSTATAAGNTIDTNSGIGIFVTSGAIGTLYGNTITGNSHGIQVQQENSQATVTANTVQNNTLEGLFVVNHASAMVTANSMTGNSLSGIVIDQSSTATLANNHLAENHQYGVYVLGQSATTLTSNVIRKNSTNGIVVGGGANAMIMANTIDDNRHNGVWIVRDSATATLIANVITGNDRLGILTNAVRTTLTANIMSGNQQGGVSLLFGSTATLNGGRITQNGGDGIAVANASSASISLDGDIVTVTQNSGAGIRVSKDGSSVQLKRARLVLSNNAGGAIVGPVTDMPL